MSRTASLLLRVGLAFAFLYVAYSFWTDPESWVGYIPAFARDIGFSQGVLLMLIAGVHVVIGLWILSGWRIFYPSLAAALFLSSIVYFNRNQFDILFRDVSLACCALALAFSSRN